MMKNENWQLTTVNCQRIGNFYRSTVPCRNDHTTWHGDHRCVMQTSIYVLKKELLVWHVDDRSSLRLDKAEGGKAYFCIGHPVFELWQMHACPAFWLFPGSFGGRHSETCVRLMISNVFADRFAGVDWRCPYLCAFLIPQQWWDKLLRDNYVLSQKWRSPTKMTTHDWNGKCTFLRE
jgi:hypothetical protein